MKIAKSVVSVITLLMLLHPAANARKIRIWREGTVIDETSENRLTGVQGQAQRYNGPTQNRVTGSATNVYMFIENLKIRGSEYVYVVACAYRRPNVAVNGRIHYVVEGSKFYLLDDDGKEFRMEILRRTLID